MGSPLVGDPVDGRASRIAEAEVAGHLVEGLAGGVVDGAPHEAVATRLGHFDQERVAAGRQEHDQRPAEIGLLEEGGEEVGLEVVDPDQGHPPCQREGFGLGHPYQQGTDQTRSVRDGHGVDPGTGGVGAGIGQGLGQHRGEQLHMGAAGEFGDDAAVLGVQVDLAADHRGHDHRAAVDHRRRRLVTRGLDAEDPVHGTVGHPSDTSQPGPERGHRTTAQARAVTCRSGDRRASMAANRSAYRSESMSRAHMTRASSPVSG